ncbi:MAG: helix-turn-helix domain-containing protein [Clostridia bacterium]|nr:helix-turn-helix domain-containing protein [Clostridia bacterium]
MNSVENVCEYYSHFNDNIPINIFAVGESIWYDDCFFERSSSEITAIEFVVSGYGVLENNGKKYDIGPKDVFLLRKGTQHKYYNNRNSTLHKLFITLSGELPEILLNQYLPGHDYIYHNCELEDLFMEIYDKAKKLYGNDYSFFVDEMSPEIIKLIIAISHCASIECRDTVYLMREYLDSQIYKTFSLNEMCQKFGYSKNHIINKFSEKFNITPYQYYTAKKLEAVKLYLVNTNCSLSEIAEKMSFSDQQYFSSWFKSLCGMSPSKFRSNCCKDNSCFSEKG